MRLLLDTHTLLWWQTDPDELSETTLQAIVNVEHDIFISVVNSWEMQIKAQLGKLKLPQPQPDLIQRQQDLNGFEILKNTSMSLITCPCTTRIRLIDC